MLVKGTSGNDRLIGTAGADSIQGLGGRDDVKGLGGNDTILTGTAGDVIDGGSGDNQINADPTNFAVPTSGSDGTGGDDIVVCGGGADLIATWGRNDEVRSGDGVDEVFTGDGNDVIYASGGSSTNTRAAYYRNVMGFFRWLEARHVHELGTIRSHHVAAYVEQMTRTHAAPTAKQHLAAIWMLFDWLIVGQVLGYNPAAATRGPKHVVNTGKTRSFRPTRRASSSTAYPRTR